MAGNAAIEQTGAARLDINQQSNRAIIDWRSFDIGSAAQTNFRQPGTDSIAVNRVTGGDPTQILGDLSANGRVMVLNPNGVLFGPGARIDVAGLVASTGNIDAGAFMRGDARLALTDAEGAGAVVNQGHISIAEGGLAAFVAPHVTNDGTIVAHLGRVDLAAGTHVTLDLYGDRLVEIAVDGRSSIAGALIDQAGSILADGGHVRLSAAAAREMVDDVINMSGVVQARTVSTAGGDIVLDAGDGTVTVAGTLDAGSAENRGGTIKVLGERVTLADSALLDASGATGGGTILAGGDWQGQGPERNAQKTLVEAGATLRADATAAGDGGTVVAWADGTTSFRGTISARGGAESGDGGRVEVSGKKTLDYRGSTDTRAPQGEIGMLLLDPRTLEIVSGVAGDGQLKDTTLSAELATNNVTLQTSALGKNDPDGDSGLIVFRKNAGLSWSSGNNLTLIADAEDGGTIENSVVSVEQNVVIDGTGGTGGANADFQASTVNLASAINVDGAVTGTATEVNVVDGGRIQNGVDVAASGATVNVADGTYGAFTTSFGGPANITIRAVGDGAVIDDSGGVPSSNRIVDLRADGTVFRGFTIDGPGANHVGISVSGRNVTVEANTVGNVLTGIQTTTQYAAGDGSITGNMVSANYGISLQNTGNTVTGNTVTAAVEGVGALPGTNSLSDNSFTIDVGGQALALYGGAVSSTLDTSENVVTVGEGAGLQRAIDLAGEQGVLNIGAGTYAEDLTISKSMSLVGDGADVTTIIGQAGGQKGAVTITADDVTLGGEDSDQGFRIEGTGVRAVFLDEDVSGATVQNNTIVAAQNQIALDTTGTQNNHTIRANTFTAAGSGTTRQLVYINGTASLGSDRASSKVDILDNVFAGTAQLALGHEAAGSRIEGNSFTGSNSYAAVELWAAPQSLSGNAFATDTPAHIRVSANANTGALDYGSPQTILAANDFATAVVNRSTSGAVVVGASATIHGQIHAAIDAAAANDVIDVLAGLYSIDERITVDKALVLNGAQAGIDARSNASAARTPGGTDESIIDGGDSVGTLIRIAADEVTIDGFELRNGTDDLITSSSSSTIVSPIIRNNIVHGSSGDEGMQIRNSQNAVIAYNRVYDTAGDGINLAGDNVGGVVSSTGGMIRFNEVHDIASPDGGIYVYGSTNTKIQGNRVHDVLGNDGIKLGDKTGADATKSGGSILDNIVENSIQDGISVYSSNVTVSGNTIRDSRSENGAIFVDFDVDNIAITNNVIEDSGTAADAVTTFAIRVGKDDDPTNVTISGNTYTGNEAQIFHKNGAAELHSILLGNSFDRSVLVAGSNTIWSSIQDGIGSATAGDTIGVGAGRYTGGIDVDKQGLVLNGADNAIVTIASGPSTSLANAGFTVNADDITIDGFTLRGPYDGQDYRNIDWSAETNSYGVFVSGNRSGMTISNNDFAGVRTGIHVGKTVTGATIAGNTIDNTKGGILLRSDEADVTLADNTQGTVGNEWGIVLNLHDIASGGAASAARQSEILAFSTSNGGMSVLDRRYDRANRTHVSVDDGGTATAADDFGFGNGLGNPNRPLATIEGGIDAVVIGGTVSVAAGNYDGGVNLDKQGLLLAGADGATINVSDSSQAGGNAVNGINVSADDVTISGFEIAGPVDTSWLSYDWDSKISRGIAVSNGVTGFTIENNNISNVRNGILVDGRNTGTVRNNTIDNTRSGVSVQYTDGSDIIIAGNSQKTFGNEWGLNLHLNGNWDGTTVGANPTATAPTAAWQEALLDLSTANGGWSVQDQTYTEANRTHVTVATTGSDSNQGSALTPRRTIASGIAAAVAGGAVRVGAGTYAENVTIGKALTLAGAGTGQTRVAPASGTPITINAGNVTVTGITSVTPTTPDVKDVIPTTPTTTTTTTTTTNTTTTITPPPVAQADLPETVILNAIAPAAGGGATGGAPAPQLVVTNDTSSVGTLIGGGDVVVLDLDSGIDSFSQSTSLTPPPAASPPPAPAGGGSATPSAASSQAPTQSGGSGGSSSGSNSGGESTQPAGGNEGGGSPGGGADNGAPDSGGGDSGGAPSNGDDTGDTGNGDADDSETPGTDDGPGPSDTNDSGEDDGEAAD